MTVYLALCLQLPAKPLSSGFLLQVTLCWTFRLVAGGQKRVGFTPGRPWCRQPRCVANTLSLCRTTRAESWNASLTSGECTQFPRQAAGEAGCQKLWLGYTLHNTRPLAVLGSYSRLQTLWLRTLASAHAPTTQRDKGNAGPQQVRGRRSRSQRRRVCILNACSQPTTVFAAQRGTTNLHT